MNSRKRSIGSCMATYLVICAPRMRSFYQKFRNFYYLLSRAQSKVLTLISYILYFTVYFLLFVNCRLLPTFFSCVYVRKSVVWCVYSTFFLAFLLPLFISHRIPLEFFFIFCTFLSRVAMQGIECSLLLLM